MSDEKPIVGEGPPIISTTRSGEDLELQFADCRHVVPDYVVAKLGGVEEVERVAVMFEEMTFAQFMLVYNRAQQRESLNRIGAAFVRGALERRQ